MVADVWQIFRVRHVGSKLRRIGLLVALMAGLCYLNQGPTPVHPSIVPTVAFQEQVILTLENSNTFGHILIFLSFTQNDQVFALQAELGYLRQKLASCDPSSTFTLSSLDTFTPIYIVTPTYARPQQKAELTRLKNTFLLIPSVHWIVIEDAPAKTSLVTRFVKHIFSVHIN